ncbi:MAG: peptidylprolyl isomerase [Polyangiaceae bacterium]
MATASNPGRGRLRRLLGEPLLHFFLIGALLFSAQRWVVGDRRTIIVTPGLQAELRRRFQDLTGHKPAPTEFTKALAQWEREEALFREAQRERLDRDDPSVRVALVDKMHSRAGLEVPKREPTQAELDAWLAAHRSTYESPLRYDFEFVTFAKAEPAAEAQLERFSAALDRGANAATMGRAVTGGNLTEADMKGRIEPELAAILPQMALGKWQRVETPQSFLLSRVAHVDGGLPSAEVLRPQLIVDWTFADRQQAIERVLQRTVDLYRVELRP